MAQERAPRDYAGIHLLWLLPVALFLSYFTLTISVLAYCGFGGCSGEAITQFENLMDAAVPLGLTFLLIGLPIFLVPWSREPGVRAAVAITTGAVVTAAGFVLFVNILP
jgi:hypothetical protein